MKSVRTLSLVALATLCLAGCKTYLANKLPPCNGLTEKMRAACTVKHRCFMTCALKSVEPRGGIFPTFLYARMEKDDLESRQRNMLLDLMQESCLFDDVLEGEKEAADVSALSMKVSTWIDKPTGYADQYDFSFLFDVRNAQGVRHQYRMGETVFNTFGGNTAPGLMEMFGALHRKVVNNLLVKMYEDGFFAGETLSSGISANVRTTVISEERKKNLGSLLKAGVITEEEYKKELGKGTK